MAPGVRITGSRVLDEEVELDSDFQPAPIPRLLGVPLLVRRLVPTHSAAEEVEMLNKAVAASKAVEVEEVSPWLMADPNTGMPPVEWQDPWQPGGALGPLTEVLVAREDQLPFTAEDWAVLDDYICSATELATAAYHRGKLPPPQKFTPEAFRVFVQREMSVALENRKAPIAFLDLVPELELRFPKGAKVKPRGLSRQELNGVVGVVTRYETEKGRVGIQFPEPFGLLSLKARSLEPEETYAEWNRNVCSKYGFMDGGT
ncbi:unnamed protein product [Polarella glacialis]|uniref:Uncharacterized protein n=1 Tax=Polarella glacialis TaxID=89957 RepID=A0A813J335_POLGL|nr:unnamed protein product [Polarella glacialis]